MSSLPSRLRLFGPIALLLLILVAVSLAIPRSASADSVVYVKGGDVWLAEPDGGGQFRVTSTGGYSYASQSENGVIVAAKENRIHRISRGGTVEAELPTIVQSSDWHGPFEPQISPDGKTVAYEFYRTYGGDITRGTAYIDARDGSVVGELQTGWSFPAWIDNDRTMQSGSPNALAADVIIRGKNEPNNQGTPWFTHPDAGGVRDGDITRTGDKLAFVAGDSDQFLTVYRRIGELGVDVPEYCYHYGEATGGKFRSPSFSPDGSSLAWEEGDGIYIGPIPDFAGGCSMPEIEGPLVIPGGTFPDWGPGDVPAPRNPSLAPARRQKLRAALKGGLLLRATDIPAGTKVTAAITKATARKAGLGRKPVTVARGTTGTSSTVRLAFTKSAARKLAKLRGVPLKVTAAGNGVRAGLGLTLRR
ncbi:MAG TPA: hypothetical protein VMF31_13225 [Solirubrobacterales bacterium]|nr:hypothetical protein [Solirubrobacterales bacterium]